MRPWAAGLTFWNALCGAYVLIFCAYWLYNLAFLFVDLRAAADIRHFTTNKLGLSERQLQTVTWPEVASRIVQVRGRSLSLLHCSPYPYYCILRTRAICAMGRLSKALGLETPYLGS